VKRVTTKKHKIDKLHKSYRKILEKEDNSHNTIKAPQTQGLSCELQFRKHINQ